jgi:alkylation response protein AidB-like acyl-CoA dehydrogenase
MDFRDSPGEAAFRAQARAFLEAHRPARWSHAYEEHGDEDERLRLQKAWQRTLFEHGWAALLWPKQYGGRGLGPVEQIVWHQELSRLGLGETLFVVGIAMAGPTLIAHGSDAQKERYLAPLLRGDEIWCQLFSEPGAGSDLAALAARAVRDGDPRQPSGSFDWVVSGQKTWCSGAHYSDFGILLARTDPTLPKHRGITYFLLDMRSPGIEVRPLRQMSGGAHFNEVFLNEVRIPDAQRLGPEGGGWAVAMTTLLNERMALGGTGGFFSFAELAAHARSRRDRLDPLLRDELARVYCFDKALELLNARVVTKLGRGQIPDAESSVMKLALGRILTRGADLGLRIAGPEGLRRQGTWQRQYLTAPSLHIAGGTDEIQKNLVAERVLGLPREARADKDVPFEKLRRS